MASDNTKHNGWSNYPTWLLASSIDNNEVMYKFFHNLSAEDLSSIIKALEELLKTDIKFMKNVNECLLDYAHSQINLPEIARSIQEE